MRARLLAGLAIAATLSHTALAQTPAPSDSGDQNAASDTAASPHEGDFWTRDALTGNWGGKRSALEDDGILVAADSIDEVLGNIKGGTGTGAIYDGRLELLTTLNLQKLISWPDATLHANAYQIHGRGLSANYLGGNLMTASNIEATRTTRLFDLWIEQTLFDLNDGPLPGLALTGYVTTQAWMTRYPETAAAFTEALARGQELAATSRPDVEKALAKYTTISKQTAAIMATGTFPQSVTTAALVRVADLMQQQHGFKPGLHVNVTALAQEITK